MNPKPFSGKNTRLISPAGHRASAARSGPMQTGTLKKFFPEKGFGFIAQDSGGGNDLFAHKRALQGDESQIQEGVRVTYTMEIEDRTNKPKASTWQIVGGGGGGMDMAGMAAASFGAAGMGGGGRPGPYGAMGGAPALPPGWEQVSDPSTGKPYYCNRTTGESSWTVPAGAPAPAPAPAAPAGLPAGWESTTDPATGKTYYFNRATGETKWEMP